MVDWTVDQQVAVYRNSKLTEISKIVRLTKTLVILQNGERFGRGKGKRRIDDWTFYHIYPATQEDIDIIERRKLRYEIEDTIRNRGNILDLAEIREIARIIKIAEKRQHENTSRPS